MGTYIPIPYDVHSTYEFSYDLEWIEHNPKIDNWDILGHDKKINEEKYALHWAIFPVYFLYKFRV